MMLPPPQSLLEHFFLFGDIPIHVETGTYSLLLVALSYVIACLGSFIGVRFAGDMYLAKSDRLKKQIHWGGAAAFGTGIWSMHFIGMLAYKMDMVIEYDPLLTALSMVIAVVIAYGVLGVIKSGRLNRFKTFGSAVLLGAAICAMHYTGMAAMEMDADLRYTPGLFVLSIVIAVFASVAALNIIVVLSKRNNHWLLFAQILAALVMGAAICGAHYTGMMAAVLFRMRIAVTIPIRALKR